MSQWLMQSNNDAVNIPDASTQEENLYKDPSIEFLVCQLPSYLFLVLALWRFYSIRHLGHSPAQPDLYQLKVIKYITYTMILTFGFNWIMCYLDYTAVNIRLKDVDFAILYLFPMLAWYWSYELTNAELKRKLEPDPINQFFFWILSIVFSAIKYFKEPKMNELVLLIDISQIALSISITYYFHSNESKIFDFIEDNEEKATLDKHLLENYKGFSIRIDHNEDMEDMESSREKLPHIEIKIPRKFQRKMLAENTFDKYFDIKVSIKKQAPYKVSHSLVEFINLAKELRIIYTLSKFKVLSVSPPSLDFENLQRLNLSDDINDVTTIIEELEQFLTTLTTNPVFMHEIVLDFLEVPNPFKKLFIDYINLAQLMNSKFSPRIPGPRRSFELTDLPLSVSGKMPSTKVTNYPLQLEARKTDFYSSKGKKDILYNFEITMTRSNGAQLVWSISKPYRAFRLLYQKMKEELGVDIPNIEEFIPRPLSSAGADASFLYSKRMLDGLEKYLKTIFSIKKLYCSTLLEFLGVNQGTLELNNVIASDSDTSSKDEN